MEVSIEAKPLLSPQACQFILSTDLSEQRVLVKRSHKVEQSPLLENLFKIQEIEEVLIEKNIITLKKTGNSTWQSLGPKIGPAIRESLKSEKPVISEELIENLNKPIEIDDEELRKRIEDVQRLLDKQVAPALAGHGGHVTLVKITGGQVHLSFGGGCQGCSQISVTVKDGIEKLLKAELPWMQEIVDKTDHGAGDDPYYS